MRGRLRLAVGVAALLLASSVPILVGHAAQATVSPWPWPMICTQADFTGYGVGERDGTPTISLAGWIQPCTGMTDPGASRSFTLYRPGNVALSQYAWPLLDPDTGSYTFSVSGTLPASVNAVCLIDGMYVKGSNAVPRRRAGVAIDQGPSGPVATPIPIGDPRMAGTIPYPWTYPGDPHCGTCL